MSKATATAPANIAFIKYWGKADATLRLPLNTSISMNLSGAQTTTTVEFSPELRQDIVTFLPTDKTYKTQRPLSFVGLKKEEFSKKESERVSWCLDLLRDRAGVSTHAHVATQNTFPKGTGAAASASGFAALTVAGFAAAGISLSEKELTIFARMGSGSACRSVPDGFVVWKRGETSDDSYAYSLYPHTYWDLRDVLVIVDFHMKKVSTTEGQEGVTTSPFWKDRVSGIPEKIAKIKAALKEKDFRNLGKLIEEDCLSMHHVMQTQNPPLFYWNDLTKTLMDAARDWRKAGLPVYFTIDAGPNVHLICQAKDEARVFEKLKTLDGILQVVVNKPAEGAHIVEKHLF